MKKSTSTNSSLLSLSFIATVVALMSGGNATAATVKHTKYGRPGDFRDTPHRSLIALSGEQG